MVRVQLSFWLGLVSSNCVHSRFSGAVQLVGDSRDSHPALSHHGNGHHKNLTLEELQKTWVQSWDPTQVEVDAAFVEHLLGEYHFIGVTERFDESLVRGRRSDCCCVLVPPILHAMNFPLTLPTIIAAHDAATLSACVFTEGGTQVAARSRASRYSAHLSKSAWCLSLVDLGQSSVVSAKWKSVLFLLCDFVEWPRCVTSRTWRFQCGSAPECLTIENSVCRPIQIQTTKLIQVGQNVSLHDAAT